MGGRERGGVVRLSGRDRKLLWGRSRNLCAFPQCRQRLSEDEVDAKTGEVFQSVIGHEAHIYSASPDGPRYEPKFPAAKLETYANRILLCSIHHTRVDTKDGRGYDAETLLKMKRRHEQQEERRDRISEIISAYVADQYEADDKVLFRQVKLEGPRVDSMFVDVPFSSRGDTVAAELLARIAADHPGDAQSEEGFVVTGAAQALLHPGWIGNALVVGGPGQGKSTLLQYVCQFHRARFRDESAYTGEAQGLQPITSTVRVPIRLDLRGYAQWATTKAATPKAKRNSGHLAARLDRSEWLQLEQYIGHEIGRHSGGQKFRREDLTTLLATEPILLALDGLDEVANLDLRDQVANEIVRAAARLKANAYNLVVVVATRPGMTKSPLWSSIDFPVVYLQKLTAGLRLQYLQRWCKVAQLDDVAAGKLQRTFLDHENLPHIRDLASYPMQLAILLHLLHRRGLLPQQRTDLYREYLETFLDREQTEDKEPLLSSQRAVIVDIHAALGWYLQKETERGKSAGQIARADLRRLLNQHLAEHEKGRELAKQLFSAMESRVLCLVEREPGFFQFEVQSLREYFAAAFIHQYADPRGSARVDCFDALLGRSYWLNTCRFFVGMFSKIEIRGIRQSLLAIQAKPEHCLHPHLRLTAGRLLDDRVYQTQPDTTIREVVEFILNGPGVVMAEDGFLDESGQPLTFAEDAGRSQAIAYLKTRLVDESSDGVRAAAARMLRRHADGSIDLARWWWGQFRTSGDWLRVTAILGVLDASAGSSGPNLAHAVAVAGSDTEWVSEVLAQGGYTGSADDVLTVCQADLNDGAVEVLILTDVTPLGKLADAARTALLRPNRWVGEAGGTARTRFRRTAGRTLVADVVSGSEQLRTRPEPNAGASVWAARLEQISKLWGDGWLLRQSIALTPNSVDVQAIAHSVVRTDPLLARLLQHEYEARSNRGNADWWRIACQRAGDELEHRSWLFSILTVAHSKVVVTLATEVDKAVADLAPKHYRAIEAALSTSPLGRRLVLQEELRKGQVSYSCRTLWLLRVVSTEGSQQQIDKKLVDAFRELLVAGMGDRRPLLRALGHKTVKVESLKGTRELLHGAWASSIKLGVLNTATANDVLKHPEEWPVEIVARAIQQAATRLSRLPPLAQLAEENRWLEPADEG